MKSLFIIITRTIETVFTLLMAFCLWLLVGEMENVAKFCKKNKIMHTVGYHRALPVANWQAMYGSLRDPLVGIAVKRISGLGERVGGGVSTAKYSKARKRLSKRIFRRFFISVLVRRLFFLCPQRLVSCFIINGFSAL